MFSLVNHQVPKIQINFEKERVNFASIPSRLDPLVSEVCYFNPKLAFLNEFFHFVRVRMNGYLPLLETFISRLCEIFENPPRQNVTIQPSLKINSLSAAHGHLATVSVRLYVICCTMHEHTCASGLRGLVAIESFDRLVKLRMALPFSFGRVNPIDGSTRTVTPTTVAATSARSSPISLS